VKGPAKNYEGGRRSALESSEEQLRLFIENVVDYAIFMLTPDGIIVSWNLGAERIKGYKADEVIGKHFSLFYSDDAVQARHPEYELSVAARDGRYQEEGWRIRKDGSKFWAHVVITAVRDRDGKVLGYGKVTHDVTERKQAEKIHELNQHLESRVKERTLELTAVSSELESFAHSVSHDLRAPLRAIDGFSELLLQGYDDKLNDEAIGYLQRVRAATQRMGHLIEGLLKLSRVSRVKFTRTRVDMSAMARRILSEMSKREPQRKVQINIADNIVAHADQHLMSLLLENLLSNAWKFSRSQSVSQISLRCHKSADEVGYEIADNGVGFDMAYVSKLFGTFQRLHSVTEFEGIGIGLATVQRIVRRHEGLVRVEGEEGRGVAVYFTLGER